MCKTRIRNTLVMLLALAAAMPCVTMPFSASAVDEIQVTASQAENETSKSVIVYRAMSRPDYLEMYDACYGDAKTQAAAYAATLDTAQYTAKEISDKEIAYFEDALKSALADQIKVFAMHELAGLDLNEDTTVFDSTYPILFCELTEAQLRSAETLEAVTAVIGYEDWTSPEDSGIHPFDYAEPFSGFSTGISDQLQEAIQSGQQELEVTMMYKSLDWKEIIQEVYQKGEEYKNSLDPTVYTADEINEMTGYYKEQLHDELCSAATEEYRKRICDSLHISTEAVTFVGNNMTCTLTPEQIMTALESDWLSRKIVLRTEVVTAEDLGYKQIEADTTLKGDANCDGKVDILDVIKVNKYILGTASLDPAGQQNADMNSNEKIDTDDVLAILKATLDIAG